MREFDTGATRDSDDTKLDFEGFLSPLVMERYAQYLHEHRLQADGNMRDSDNWQKGIPLPVYMKSAWRHFFLWWKLHRAMVRGGSSIDNKELEDTICAVLFNAQGYMHEWLSIAREQPAQPNDDAAFKRASGVMPCGKDAMVDVKFADGDISSDNVASYWDWSEAAENAGAIVGWRYSKPGPVDPR